MNNNLDFIPDAGIEHSADMIRLFSNYELAREAEYLARVAVGQNPLNPVKDKRRDKRPRCTEDLLKRLCWLSSANWQMEKKHYPGLFGPDGERWITRHELEHMGDKRVWGGKFSENQVDAALVALESQGIIERRKMYDPIKHTSKISIRVCPQNIMQILAAKKEAAFVGVGKKSRIRVAPAIASDVIFLKPGTSWAQAISAGERTRAAACELYYEPELQKYLLPLTACIKGLPHRVPNHADRRIVVEDAMLVKFLKMLLKKWRVNPTDNEFQYRSMAFTRDGWRALSHDELKAAGFTDAQIVRCKHLMVESGFLEWQNLPSPGKGEARIYARLRVDLIVEWTREFAHSGRFSALPNCADTKWIPTVIDHRSSNIITNTNVISDAESLSSRIERRVYPAAAGNKIFSKKDEQLSCAVPGAALEDYSVKCRAAMLKAPLDSGDVMFRGITRLFSEIFADYFKDHPLDHKMISQIRARVYRGAISSKMTWNDLVNFRNARNTADSNGDEWMLLQDPDKTLKFWASIKRLLRRVLPVVHEDDLENTIRHWGEDTLPEWEWVIKLQRDEIHRSHQHNFGNYYPFQDEYKLPMLVALHQLGLRDELAKYIADDRDKLLCALKQYSDLALSIQKHFPDLMRSLNVPPELWSELRQMRKRHFHQAQVVLAQTRLWNNKIDDLNAPWRVNADAD